MLLIYIWAALFHLRLTECIVKCCRLEVRGLKVSNRAVNKVSLSKTIIARIILSLMQDATAAYSV